jgi:hypothetical protein
VHQVVAELAAVPQSCEEHFVVDISPEPLPVLLFLEKMLVDTKGEIRSGLRALW